MLSKTQIESVRQEKAHGSAVHGREYPKKNPSPSALCCILTCSCSSDRTLPIVYELLTPVAVNPVQGGSIPAAPRCGTSLPECRTHLLDYRCIDGRDVGVSIGLRMAFQAS